MQLVIAYTITNSFAVRVHDSVWVEMTGSKQSRMCVIWLAACRPPEQLFSMAVAKLSETTHNPDGPTGKLCAWHFAESPLRRRFHTTLGLLTTPSTIVLSASPIFIPSTSNQPDNSHRWLHWKFVKMVSCSFSQVMREVGMKDRSVLKKSLTVSRQVLAVDLLNPTPQSEARKHKLKVR